MIVNWKNNILYIILLFVSISCQDLDKTERPENLIPEGKMVDVLTEIALLNAARNYNKQKLESTGIDPHEYIFEKFNIDSVQFEQSNNYYAEQYSDYERIYDSVKVRLQIIKTRLDSLRDIEIRIEDSIKLAKKDSLRALDSPERDTLKLDSLNLIKNRKVLKNKDSLLVPAVKFEATGESQN